MSSAFGKAVRISSQSFLYAWGLRINHIVRPARSEAVVSDPATLFKRLMD
jgi:hypothetical protein